MASSSPVATTISTASGSKTTSSAIKAPPKTSSPTSTTPTTHARYIGAFWGNLDISAFENAVIEDESLRNETGFGKLDVGVPFRLTSELIQQNGDAVYGAAALEVCLDLLGGDGVVDVADEDAAAVDVVAVVGRLLVLLLEGGVHLAQLGGLLLHLGDAALHGRNLFLIVALLRDKRIFVEDIVVFMGRVGHGRGWAIDVWDLRARRVSWILNSKSRILETAR